MVSKSPGHDIPCLMCSHDLLVEYHEPEFDLTLFLDNLNRDGNFGEEGGFELVLAF